MYECMYCNEERDRGSEGERGGALRCERVRKFNEEREKDMKRERGNKWNREKDE
jgi:hypothetical protein